MQNTTTQIQVGQRIHCILYGGKDGVVVAIHGQQAPSSVRSLGGVIMTGGRAELDIIWDDGSQSRRIHESIVHGVQWRLYADVVGADVVAEYHARAVLFTAQATAKQEAESKAKAAADVQARADGLALGLIPEADFRAAGKRGTAAAHNLRAELKKAGIKARVTADGYNCLRVNDVAPEQREQAETIGRKYKAGNFDGMSDCYEYRSNAWGRVFGDVQYVFFG